MTNRVESVIRMIDTMNLEDPNTIVCNGISFPKEYFLSKMMTEKVDILYPNASKAVKIAARAHHVQRWMIARSDYSMDKKGYHAWRNDLAKSHADTTAKLLQNLGFDEEYQKRVSDILLKKDLKNNLEAQQLEDAACLVFLEFQFMDFIEKHERSRLIDILQKTWGKMSEKAHAAALELYMPEKAERIIKEALS